RMRRRRRRSAHGSEAPRNARQQSAGSSSNGNTAEGLAFSCSSTLLLGDIGGRTGTDGDEYSCSAMRAVVMWWGSRGGGGVWICTTLLVWSRVISRCPAGNMVRRTGFLPGLTRTNTGSVRVRSGFGPGSVRVVGWRYLMRMPPVYVALFGLR